jgi:cytochrome P450
MMEPRELKGWSLLRAVPRMGHQLAEWTADVAAAYPGEVVRVCLGRASFLVLSEPSHLEHVFLTNLDNYWKGTIFNAVAPVFGKGLLLAEGEEWRHSRRVLQPAFSVQRFRDALPALEDIVSDVISEWKPHEHVDVEREMRTITMRIILHLMFSSSVTATSARNIEVGFEQMLRRVPLVFATYAVPAIGGRLLRPCVDVITREVDALVAQRRASGEQPGDLLDNLLSGRDRDGRPFSDEVIRDHVITTIFGGYEATATSLFWMWILLDRAPAVLERVHSEVDAAANLHDLPYCRQVIDETLRLYPPFWESFRTAYDDDVIGGYRIRGGESLLLSLYATHRDPRSWPNPEEFEPSRFEPGHVSAHRLAYLPFLSGPRTCIGKNLALMEMLLVARVVGRRWHLQAPRTAAKLQSRAAGSLRPRGVPGMMAVPITANRRATA